MGRNVIYRSRAWMKNVAKMEKINYQKLPLRALRKQLKLRNNRV